MEHKMLWGALAVGGAGWVCLLALSLSRRKVRGDVHFPRAMNSRVFEWLALALPLLVWLATLPTKAPFSGGQGWGRGFFLGGLVAFIGSFIALGVAKLGTHTARLAATTSLFGEVVVACVPLLWMRRAVPEFSATVTPNEKHYSFGPLAWVIGLMLLGSALVLPLTGESPAPQKLAGWSTSLKGRSRNQRRDALLSARSIGGRVVAPGGVFSFNQTVKSWSVD